MQQSKKPTLSKRTDDASRDWSHIKDRLGEQLRAQYQAITTEELPPRLLAVLKKLDDPNAQTDQPDIIRDIES